MVTRQMGDETFVVSTTTAAKFLVQAKDGTTNPIPPNPQPGDTMTFTQTRVFGNQHVKTIEAM
ncbi:hypothetical protein IFO71_02140 [Pseudoxanthomonas sp. CAU 1598]|uniref:Uncharacterized protein n=2 Tax=Pseudomarimonas arenosa TaxID=2774145 RepID=A0AAW3ZGY3_9GAMM|nr:hypothetical protein [Pseudomarimonas arenosa]